jgi:hypothetical protein
MAISPGTEPSLGPALLLVVIGTLSTLSWAFIIIIAQFLSSALYPDPSQEIFANTAHRGASGPSALHSGTF